MDELPVILEGRNVVIGISPCSRDVFAPLLNILVYVLDSLMAGHYTEHFLKSYRGLQFLLTCNCRIKDFENTPLFYKDILLYFHELKTLYGCKDTILFNNKEICINGKTFFGKEWFMKGIKRIKIF